MKACKVEEKCNSIFGFQGEKGTNNGTGSRLTTSWGYIHDSENIVVEGFKDKITDTILVNAQIAIRRDHVRISDKGAAIEHGKFYEFPVSAGHRFTFELLLEGTKEDKTDWEKLLKFMFNDSFRIGAKSHSGYGKFDVLSILEGVFDLSDENQLDNFLNVPVSLNKSVAEKLLSDATEKYKNKKSNGNTCHIQLNLKPDGMWLISGGSRGEADIVPVHTSSIKWKNNKAKVVDNYCYIPGTSIKGAISHRIAYHHNILENKFIEFENNWALTSDSEQAILCIAENNPAVKALFGFCKDSQSEDHDKQEGSRGKVFIDDVEVNETETKIINHVSIDRFTGGSRFGFLFSEQALLGNEELTIDIAIEDADQLTENTKIAFARTLEDMIEGRLSIGSGGNRGNGYFDPENSHIIWLDQKWNIQTSESEVSND